MSGPVFQRDGVSIWQGDCRDVLRAMPAGTVHTCVTSPPYWGLRQYFFDKAVVLRYDLDEETKRQIVKELESCGIKPRQAG